MASQEELQIAAAATGRGLSVEDCLSGMACDDWGDHLMVSLLARTFQHDISIISANSARTFFKDGEEQAGVDSSAVWIAHE
eukprot:11483854-Karenia_brevis.AAC.1